MKIDLENLFSPELVEQTRTTEKYVLGSILSHQTREDDQLKKVIDVGLGPEDFFIPQHGSVMDAMLKYSSEDNRDFLEQILSDAHYKEGSDYLNDLMDFGQSIRNESLIAHARALKHLSFQRQETTLIAEIFHHRKINQDASEIYDDLQRLREEIKIFERGEAEAFSSGLKEWWSDFNLRSKDGFTDDTEIKTHIPTLDDQTQGLRKTEVAVLAGSPGSGKTALALDFILSAISQTKLKTAFISLEMDMAEILSRVINQLVDVPLKYLLDPSRLQPKKWSHNLKELERINGELKKANEFTKTLQEEGAFQSVALNSFRPEAVVRTVERAADAGADLIVIDHLHRILFSEQRNFTENMTRLMITLTELAKSQRCHILALSQLNREATREGRKPRLIDLKGSGGIEENASLVFAQ